ncbi:hypothetical protein [Gordonia sp. (in: high G+C Gram-positive bacteria)]|uniref:hypothetical protein n=1 Tax=Gordonia sp. (in: high G+C Gram-positive bacteria) TaxID=84139 RepID=UPI003C7388C8
MRKSWIFLFGVIVAIIGLGIAAMAGILTPTTAGIAQPNAVTRAANDLSAALTGVASAPAATYTGTLNGDDALSLQLDNVTVTAAGDLRGKVSSGGGNAEVLMVGDVVLVKGDAEFWRDRHRTLPPGVTLADDPNGKWAVADPNILGVDLRAALRPNRLATSLSQSDKRIGGSDITGADASPTIAQTPDRRVNTGIDPVDVRELDDPVTAEEFNGTRQIRAGDVTSTLNDDGALVGFAGPMGSGFFGDQANLRANLKIASKSVQETTSFYESISSSTGEFTEVQVPSIAIPDPTGGLDCTLANCTLTYNFRNSASGLTGGEVTIKQDAELKMNGSAAGKCTSQATMPINGGTRIVCSIRINAPSNIDINFNSTSKFALTTRGRLDVAHVQQMVTTGRERSVLVSEWVPVAPKQLASARNYNRAIAGTSSSYAVKVGDMLFDAREVDGTLLLVMSPGYDAHVLPNGVFDPAWPGTNEILELGRNARKAAGDKPVRMVFAEQRAGDAARKLLGDGGVANVEVVVIPMS